MWTLDHLEKISGVSLRTLRDLESEDRTARIATIECLAKAYGVEPRDLARPVHGAADPKPRRRASAPPPAPAAPVPVPAYGVTQLPKQTRLEQLVVLERALEPMAPLTTRGVNVPPLDAKKYQDIFTAYAPHEGGVFYVTGRVDLQRGISREEAALLGTRSGVGARFHFVRDVAPGHEIGMTVHTARGEDTVALQEALGAQATAVVRVVLAPEETVTRGEGFTFFMSERPRPWALRVEHVVQGAPPPKRGKRN
jgi:hypothetical protein